MSDCVCPKCSGPVYRDGRAGSGNQRWTCKLCKHRTTRPVTEQPRPLIDQAAVAERLTDLKDLKRSSKIQRYVISSAQNNTSLHPGFFASVQRYCKHNKAELLIIPIRYQNPTSWKSRHSDESYWYPDAIAPFIINKPVILNKNLVVMADIKIQATAADPITGLETVSGIKSAIFGHGQVRMKMVATPQDRLPKMLHTTGSVSKKNYSGTKAGAKGKHHHSVAAVVVEVEGDRFYIREIYADTGGSFYDLDKLYTPAGIKGRQKIAALVTGDEHALFMDDDVRLATYDNSDSVVAALKPETIVRHDVLDFYAQNHHHKNNRIVQYIKATHRLHDVRKELNKTLRMIEETTPKKVKNLIISSNHNDALMRWLNDYRADRDPFNALIYHELSAAVFGNAQWTAGGAYAPDPFALYAKGKLKCKHEFLSNRKSYLIKGIDVAQHGHRGANGARGTLNSFAASEYKMIIGHSHSPGIRFGCFQVGTSTHLQLEYNTGLSSWLNTHCIIYPNGKRSLIHIIKGKWRA